jgi:hypothetical protein
MVMAQLHSRRTPTWLVGCTFVSVLFAGFAFIWFMGSAQMTQVPAVGLLAAATTLVVAFACFGQIFVHRIFREQDFVQHNEVGGFIIAVAGMMYAAVLGFLTAVAWQHFADARQLVALEAAAAADTWHMAVGLPRDERSRVRRDVAGYARLMVSSEWPAMRDARFDVRGDTALMDAMNATGSFDPQNGAQFNAQTATMQQLGIMHDVRPCMMFGSGDSRRMRVGSSRSSGSCCSLERCVLWDFAGSLALRTRASTWS